MSRSAIFFSVFGLALAGPPAWLPLAGLGFLEGFTNTTDVDKCIMGAMTPLSDVTSGITDIKKGLKERNLTDIEEGVTSLRKLMQDLPVAMQGCMAEEQDVQAILKVLKSFHSLKDIIAHIKGDLAADEKGEIAAQFELMVRSFKAKQYEVFGKHAGQLLHRLFVGPRSFGQTWPSKCSGTADPAGPFPKCYEATAGAMGQHEDVKVQIKSYANSKGTLDLTGSGIEDLKCTDKTFTKSGQEVTPEMGDCLPSKLQVKGVEYCSDQDEIKVTVKVSKVPFPVSATAKQVSCGSTVVV